MDGTWLFLSGLFSLIGVAVCLYGRRRRLITPTLVGIALMGYPYFVDSYLGLIGVGLLLVGLLVVGTRRENGI
jgi:hypothetical protein